MLTLPRANWKKRRCKQRKRNFSKQTQAEIKCLNLLSICRKYDPNDLRSIDAALRFYSLRKAAASRTCPDNLKNSAEGRLEVMGTKQLNQLELKSNEKVLICKDLSKRALSDFKLCNFDSTLPAAVSLPFLCCCLLGEKFQFE